MHNAILTANINNSYYYIIEYIIKNLYIHDKLKKKIQNFKVDKHVK